METKFWVNAGMWSLVAQDRELNLTDMRTLVFVMSQNEDGACPMSLSQMGGVLDIDRASLSRSLRKLDKLGYIEKTDGGWILRSCFMFMGKRNQQNKVNRMEQAMTIKERRLRFREKIEAALSGSLDECVALRASLLKLAPHLSADLGYPTKKLTRDERAVLRDLEAARVDADELQGLIAWFECEVALKRNLRLWRAA